MKTTGNITRAFVSFGVITLILTGTVLSALWALRAWFQARAADRIYTDINSVPPAPVALVLGAGLWKNGIPTPALYDRVATAVDLYRAGKVKKLLMTGDNRFVNYNEPEAMRKLALQLGVPDRDIVLDYAGRRTYDSCYRAKEIFQVSRVVIVTQRFHLDRSLFLCDAMGIPAIGFAADRRPYQTLRWWELREVLATAAAWWDVNIGHPVPVLGERLPLHVN
jgi:SanA protein